jgi:hypothetical protein
MSNPIRKPAELDPRGPEGVPVDAPDNDAPAISPHSVSRMHRAEDDRKAIENSPDFSDAHSQSSDDRAADIKGRRPNPSHDTAKDAGAPPKGRGDGELQQQPATQAEARQPGADNPQVDE